MQPLRAVLSETLGDQPVAEASLLQISDPRVQLVGLQHQPDDRLLIRLRSNAIDGLTTQISLPAGATGVNLSSYLGDPGGALDIADGVVTVAFRASGVRAPLVTLPAI